MLQPGGAARLPAPNGAARDGKDKNGKSHLSVSALSESGIAL
jgi:hypothetical protein